MWISYIWTTEKQKEDHFIEKTWKKKKIQASWDADRCDTGAALSNQLK